MVWFLPVPPVFPLDSPEVIHGHQTELFFLCWTSHALSLLLSLHLLFPWLLLPFTFFTWENPTHLLDSAEVPLPLGSPSGFTYPPPPLQR